VNRCSVFGSQEGTGTMSRVFCVDPFRNQPLAFGEQGVARHGGLHGFGKPGMYRYSFSEEELQRLYTIVNELPRSITVNADMRSVA